MNNNDLRVKRTRRLLMDALMHLVITRPIEKVTVIDICEEAMVNRATFYAHFEDKYDLLNACIEDFFKPYIRRRFENHTMEGYEEYFTKVVHDILVHIEDNIKVYKALVKKNNILGSVMINFIEQLLSEKCKLLEESGIKLPASPEIIASFYAGAIYNVVVQWIMSKHRAPAKEIAEQLATLFKGAVI